jgi:cyclohexyl-isocyanide hydratase
MNLGVLLFNDVDQLDVTAPLEVFNNFPDTNLYLISNNLNTISSNVPGVVFKPNSTFKTTPQLDVLFIPGGKGIISAINNQKLVDFVIKQSLESKYISSVCTGALILGHAGLLNNKSATTHWMAKKYLMAMNIKVSSQRVVIDHNVITGAGITSGIDVALTIADLLYGKDFVQSEELILEYVPHSTLYDTTIETANPKVIKKAYDRMANIIKARDAEFMK